MRALLLLLLAGCHSDPVEAPAPAQAPQRQPGHPPMQGGLPHDPNAPTPTAEGDAVPTPSAPEATLDAQGMVAIPAGWVELGPRRINAVPGAPDMAPMGPMPGGAGDAAQHGAHGAARAAGGPPPVQPGITPESLVSDGGEAVPWRSGGGESLPKQRVWVEAFRMDRTEITRAAYARFLEDTGYKTPYVDEDWARDDHWNWAGTAYPEGTGDHPVVLVSWYDASEYCAWAGKRLPSEAEWQLAALGPMEEGRIFPWGNGYGSQRMNHGKMEVPNYDEVDGYLTTAPVGSFPGGRSALGLEDMFGNAWEFTADLRVDSWALVQSVPVQGGLGQVHAPPPGLHVAVRGGSYFFDFRQNPGGERNHFLPELRRKTSGFRCAAGPAGS